MAPGLVSNPYLSIFLYTSAVALTANYAFSSYLANTSSYCILLCALPLGLAANLFHYMIIYPFFFSPLRHLPCPREKRHWLLGNEGTVIFGTPRGAGPLRWMKELQGKSSGGLIRYFGFFNEDRLIVTNPQALADVLHNNCYDFEKPTRVRNFLARVIGWGLILAEGDMHKLQRKTMVSTFTVAQIRDLYPIFWDKTNCFLEALTKSLREQPSPKTAGLKTVTEHPEGIVEIAEWASRVTLDIIGIAAMGREFHCLRDGSNEIARAYIEILEPTKEKLYYFAIHTVIPHWLSPHIPIAFFQRLNKVVIDNVGTLRRICNDIVNEQRSAKAEDSKKSKSILASMIRKGDFTDQELEDQMLTFLAAGHETTASTLTWCCYVLAKNPLIQERLRHEIRTKIPSRNHQITAQDLESLPYLNGVCQETLRLYPTVPATLRQAMKDSTISGHFVPKNTLVLILPYAVNRNPEMWTDGDEFIPERWIDMPEMSDSEKYEYLKANPEAISDGRPNNNGGACSNYANITFLHGPRQCVAHSFAHAELRCMVAGMAGAFEWEMADPNAEIKTAGVITTKPTDGMWLKMKALDGW